MALGPRDTRQLVLLTGWDATELSNYKLQDGTTYARVVAEMNAALGALNAELANDPLWAGLVSFTDQLEAEYRIGAANGFEDFTEYGEADNKRADTEGHMLPLRASDRRLGWTWDYLRKARMTQIQADIADAIKDARDLYRRRILTRLLKRTDDSGKANGLGASGYSTGFATTAASTAVDFVPPSFGGVDFAATHEHYVPIAGGVFTVAVFTDAKSELFEHGHEPPYDFLIGSADEAAVRALTGFVPVENKLVTYGSNATLATLPAESQGPGVYYIGTLNDFAIRVVPGMPQYYGFAYKSYGRLSQRNPLRIRLQKGETAPKVIAMTDPRAGNATLPIQSLMLFMEFGVGVGDRTNGTPRYVNNATWADGTPT